MKINKKDLLLMIGEAVFFNKVKEFKKIDVIEKLKQGEILIPVKTKKERQRLNAELNKVGSDMAEYLYINEKTNRLMGAAFNENGEPYVGMININKMKSKGKYIIIKAPNKN